MKLKVPVADLRSGPNELIPKDFSHNPSRLSQIICGERLDLLEERGEWLFVEAKEQLRFSQEKGWHGYPGWVHISEVDLTDTFYPPYFVIIEKNLSFGRYVSERDSLSLRSLSSPFSRKQLIQDALSFLGAPYLWGGKAFFSKEPIASVDCSGLTHLLYRAQGILIPRDAHDQFLKCKRIEKEELMPGDLLFWAPCDNPERVTHVVIYQDRGHFIEAPKTGEVVRILPLPFDFWQEQQGYYFPRREKPYLVFCGRFA